MQAVGEPIFGEVTAYALEPSSVEIHGKWIQGLPFIVAGSLEVGALLFVLIAFTFQGKIGLPTFTSTSAKKVEKVCKEDSDVPPPLQLIQMVTSK